MSPLVDTTYFTLWPPGSSGVAFLGLEAVVLLCGALTFVHARRSGNLFTWSAIFIYGVALEIIAYNAFPNFTHGQFTVMFYHRKLPLYVTFVYPVMLYTSWASVRRLGLPAWAQAVVTGLAIVALDAPFDIVGPDAGFWSWSALDPNVGHRWLGVPVTSYYWHLTWGAILTALGRLLEPRLPRVGPVLVAGATIALGRVAFLPFDLLLPLGVSQGAIAASAIGLAAAVALAVVRPARRADSLLLASVVLFAGFHAVMAAWLYQPLKAATVATALVALLGLHARGRGSLQRTAPPLPEPAPRPAESPSSTTT